ncbi:MAG: hypothetical protein EHM34_00335 [Nitrosopumilales archaeon]|nr:MAG: hypothetical protein EHM34_00335 [Nitrosopumilales archaeon]
MIEKHIFFDLDINEVAMIMHTFLKKFETGYKTINFHVEEVTYDDTSKEQICISKHTLVVIVSRESISKQELMKIFDHMMLKTSRSRI